MDAVVVDEAETRRADLLDRGERGEEVTITRHGKVVAKLVPSAQMKGKFDWQEWKAYRDEGRP